MNTIIALLISIGCFVWFVFGLYYLIGKGKSNPHEEWWKKSRIKRTVKSVLGIIMMGPFGIIFVIFVYILEYQIRKEIRKESTYKNKL